MMKRAHATSGFTLMELIVVTIILGIVTGMALPRLMAFVERMRAEQARQVMLSIYGAQKRYWLDNGSYASSVSQLDITLKPNPYFTFEVEAGDLAEAERKPGGWGGVYELEMNAQGRISCSGAICPRLGF